jgi:hypothetical protein
MGQARIKNLIAPPIPRDVGFRFECSTAPSGQVYANPSDKSGIPRTGQAVAVITGKNKCGI